MKTGIGTNTVLSICIGVLVIIGGLVNSAGAAEVLYEGFDYTPTDGTLAINGLNGGIGFDGAWYSCYSSGSTPNPASIVSGVSFGSLHVSGGALERTEKSDSDAAARVISSAAQTALTQDNTTMWFSILMKANNGGNGLAVNSYATMIFGNAGLSEVGGSNRATIGAPDIAAGGSAIGIGFCGTQYGTSNWSDMRIQGITYDNGVSTVIRGDRQVVGNDLVMIVGKVDWAADGTDDVLSLYNILNTTAALPVAFTTMNADLDQSTFNIISIGDSQTTLFDEVRFGTSYADVIPEDVTPPVTSESVGDSFDYSSGSVISGQGGAIDGWAGPWTGSGDNMHQVVSGLTFDKLSVSGGAVQRPDKSGTSVMSRQISAAAQTALTADGTTTWFSVVVNPGSNCNPMNSYGTLIFGDAELINGNGWNAASIAAGGNAIGVGYAGNVSGGWTFTDMLIQGVTYKDGVYTENISQRIIGGDATVFIVGKVDWASNGNDDVVSLYKITDPANPLPVAFSTMSVDLDQTAFNVVSIGDGQRAVFDEIRLGTNYEDVISAPIIVNAGVDMITWSGEPVQLAPEILNNTPGNDLTYAWSADPVDGVAFSQTDIEAPTVTINKTTENPSVVTLTLSVNYVGNPPEQAVQDTMTIDVYDDLCKATVAYDTELLDPSDLNHDCIIDIQDLILLAQTWLADYMPAEPFAK